MALDKTDITYKAQTFLLERATSLAENDSRSNYKAKFPTAIKVAYLLSALEDAASFLTSVQERQILEALINLCSIGDVSEVPVTTPVTQ